MRNDNGQGKFQPINMLNYDLQIKTVSPYDEKKRLVIKFWDHEDSDGKKYPSGGISLNFDPPTEPKFTVTFCSKEKTMELFPSWTKQLATPPFIWTFSTRASDDLILIDFGGEPALNFTRTDESCGALALSLSDGKWNRPKEFVQFLTTDTASSGFRLVMPRPSKSP